MIPQFMHLSRAERVNAIRFIEAENEKYGKVLLRIPVPAPTPDVHQAPVAAWRSQEFLVQAFNAPSGVVRLSVNRTHVDPGSLRWVDGITWDDLQRLKREAGYGDREAVEIYPPDGCVVDVANIRHLWILPERMPFSWGP